MQLRKYHGLGNDFLILLDPDGKVPVDADLTRAVCDRHRGVGADGFIRVTSGLRGPNAMAARMELWNADGSRAETSGNGLRCVTLALIDAGIEERHRFTVVTDAGPREVQLHDDGMISVEMGSPTVDGANVDLGNPHRIVLMDGPPNGQAPEHDEANVELVWPGPGADEITMRVWERGVGETQACGSGACAAAVVAHAAGLVGRQVTVRQPGGAVTVDLYDPIVLTGPAQFVCEVTYPWP